jgi:hypothetical protein
MKKIAIPVICLLLFGAGCQHTSNVNVPAINTPPAASVLQPLTDGEEVLKQLSLNWQKDGDLAMHVKDAKNNLESCSNIPSSIAATNVALVPPTYSSLLVVATHTCDAALWVYAGCTNSIEETDASDQWVSVGGKWYACGGWTEKMILEDLKTGQARILGDLNMVTGGNYGGLFVPMAFTKDDSRIILNAWMFSPGAGGGDVDLGYKVASVDSITNLNNVQSIFSLPRQTIFYGDFGKAVYLGNSKNLPSFSQPGPQSNLGTIMSLDLTTMKSATVLEEADTTYQLVGVDEVKNILSFKATNNQFTKACPRAEDALICSQKTVQDRTLPLP